MIDAYYPSLCLSLGLGPKDLQDIGGYNSDRFPRDLIAGRKPFPEDVREALKLIQDDVDVMIDSLVARVLDGDGAIFVFRTNKELREHFPEWPGRGQSDGGFVGPHRVAAIAAHDVLLEEHGIETSIIFGSDY